MEPVEGAAAVAAEAVDLKKKSVEVAEIELERRWADESLGPV